MQETSLSLQLMLRYSTKQPLRTNKQYTVLPVNRPTIEMWLPMYVIFSSPDLIILHSFSSLFFGVRDRLFVCFFLLLFSFFCFVFFTFTLTKLTDGTVCLVCPDSEWDHRLIGSSPQRRRYLFIYLLSFFYVFQARGEKRKASSAERESRSSRRTWRAVLARIDLASTRLKNLKEMTPAEIDWYKTRSDVRDI